MTVAAEVLDWIRDAAGVADSWASARAALQARDDARVSPFVIAFGYALHERSSAARERAGGPFGAMVAGDGWRFPPALEDIPDENLEAWRDVLAGVDHPAVHARLGGLLWVRKAQPDPHLAAAAACDGLVAVAENGAWRSMDRVRCLSRALELARETRDAPRQATAVERMIRFRR